MFSRRVYYFRRGDVCAARPRGGEGDELFPGTVIEQGSRPATLCCECYVFVVFVKIIGRVVGFTHKSRR